MRLRLSYGIVSLFMIAIFAGIVPADADPAPEPEPEPEPREEPAGAARLIVGHDGTLPLGFDRILAEHGARLLREDTVLDFAVVTLPAGLEAHLLDTLRATQGVTYAKTDGMMEAYYQPNDPRYAEQWGPATIGMEEAWDSGFGNHSIEVGVLDTGVDYTHPDLDDNVCRLGPDFYNDDDDPYDDHYHGTHVAGTVAAELDNLQGVAGMANACVVPVKVLSGGGSGHWSDLASALTWSADNGIEIVSMSLGGCAGCDPGEPVTSAMKYAAQKGVLIIAAAGNAYCDAVGYPAAYPEAIAVASTRSPGDETSSFSSCGPEVEVAAPGEDIISTMPGNTYDHLSGTSMATPHVSGAAALFWSHFPALGADVVRCIMAQNADDILAPGPDHETGYGRIDVAAMLTTPDCVPKPPLQPDIEVLPGDGTIHLGWNKPFAWGGVDGYEIHRGMSPDALTHYATVGDDRFTFTDTNVTVGTTYHYAVAAYNDAGTGAFSPTITITAQHAVDAPTTWDFEDGDQGWSTSGLWHRDDVRADSGEHSMWFGHETGGTIPILDPVRRDYATGDAEYGTLVSPPLKVPQNASRLSFWEHLDLQGAPAEHGLIEVSRASDPFNFTTLWSKGWSFRHVGDASVDLSDYAGDVVTVRFVVETGDRFDNGREGWHVDTISFDEGEPVPFGPQAVIGSPYTWEIQGATIFVDGIFSDANGDADVVNVTFEVPGSAPVDGFIEGHRFYGGLRDAPTGRYNLTVTVRDSTGLEMQTVREVTVDADPPQVFLTSPGIGSVHDCVLDMTGYATDTGGAGLYFAYAFASRGSTLEVESHSNWYDFSGGDNESFELTVSLAWLDEGPVDVYLQTYDRAFNWNQTVFSFEKTDVECDPQIDLTPSDGETVGGRVDVSATIDFYGNSSGWYYLIIDGEWVRDGPVSDGGTVTYTWDTFDLADGNHTIRVFVSDDAIGANNETEITVNVSNPRDPTVVHEASDGQVGCSAGILIVRLRDACDGDSHQTSEVDPGLTAIRVNLTWDPENDLESLSVTVRVGVESWEVSAGPGDDQIVLHIDEGEVLTGEPLDARIEVRASFGGTTPSVALDQHYHLEVDWAYWGASI